MFQYRFPHIMGLSLAALVLLQPCIEFARGEGEAPGKDQPTTDPYAVPSGDVNTLIKFIEGLQQMRPRAKTRFEYIAHFRKASKAMTAAADKALAASPTDDQTATLVTAKFKALKLLVLLQEKGAAEELQMFSTTVAADKRPAIARIGKVYGLLGKAETWTPANEEDEKKFVEEAVAVIGEKIDMYSFRIILDVGRSLEKRGLDKTAGKFYAAIGSKVMQSDNPRIAGFGKKFAGMARRLLLVGNPMEIKGTTLEGKEFDWSAYKGKVVLVDFWATWCAPCRAELPNVKKQYELYHDKGFEIVGISLDRKKNAVVDYVKQQNIPWTNLFSNDPDATGWNHPMAEYYGVMAIPTTILVGKDGKVITLSARGQALGQHLEKLLGATQPEKPK